MSVNTPLHPLGNSEHLADVPGALSEEARRIIDKLSAENRSLRQEIDRLSIYRNLAYRDDLTGLYNRRHFTERLAQEWSRAARYGKQPTLVLMDLDDFKQINDSAGHATGDYVLRFVGRHMTAECREFDIPCRLGGDEFAYILPETDLDGARAVATRLCEALTTSIDRPTLPNGLAVGLSFGIAEGAAVSSPAELVARADEAMYAHKRSRKAASSRGGADFLAA